jgi:transglutaminase superfamily protein
MSAPSLAVRDGRLPVTRKINLALETLRTYGRVRRELRRRTLPEALERLRMPGFGTASPEETARLARAVRRTLRLLPTDTRCLSQSLVLISLLARRGVPSTLVIGVSPGESFGAHAWVENHGVPLLPPFEADFQRLVEL